MKSSGVIRNRKINPSSELQPNSNKKQNIDEISKQLPPYSTLIQEKLWSITTALYIAAIFFISWTAFTHLPHPKSEISAKPKEFIEEFARSHLEKIVGFGHRPAGSIANDVNAVRYILDTVKEIKTLSPPTIQVQVDIQHPTGSFNMDFFSGFASYYTNITNTIVKISPTAGVSNHALLLNCHTDTAAGVPGASDDAVACAVLLEIMRAFALDNEQPLLHPVIFLFNGAEENVLQASHGFITQHPWAKQVKAFINLEAAGAGGKELVFQTGPSNPWLAMTWAAHAPHPFGTIVAQELFQSGVIPAETDFRIFRDFGKIPGIDLAYMRNGYVYHSVYDNMNMIQPGAIQRAGDNILAVLKHLVKSNSSLLPNPSVYKHGSTSFIDIMGLYMLTIPVRLLTLLNWACSVGSFLFIARRLIFAADRGITSYALQMIKALGVVCLAWIACFSTVLSISGFLTVYGRVMSFYSHPSLVVFIYSIPGFLSILAVHKLAQLYIFKNEDPWKLEQIFFNAYLLFWSIALFQFNYLRLQSSLVFFLSLAPIMLIRCLFCRHLFNTKSGSTSNQRFFVYLLSTVPHCWLVMKHAVLMMEFFIPLCNRLGSVAPPDLVIAFMAAFFVCLFCHFFLSTIYIVDSIKRISIVLIVTSCLGFLLAFSSYGFPYSYSTYSPTTKRLYIQHTSREFHIGSEKIDSDSGLWINTMDYPGFSTDMGSVELKESSPMPCEGIFCRSPWILPIYHLIRHSRYLPAPDPFQEMEVKDPLQVRVLEHEMTLLVENSTTSIFRKRLSFLVSGPSHMSLQIGTRSSKYSASRLTTWSLNTVPDDVNTTPLSDPPEKNQTYNDCYFIYYGSGIEPLPWRPWFEFLVYQSKDNTALKQDPTVEIGFASHHFSDTPIIPVPEQTEAIRSITKDLHDWVMQISWVSAYKSYLF